MTIAIGEDQRLNCSADVLIKNVPVKTLTAENFSAYGEIVEDFDQAEVQIITWPQSGWRPIDPGTGNEGGVTQGDFEIYRQGRAMYAENHAVDGHYVTGWFSDPRASDAKADFTNIYTREANYHPDGGQVFFSRNHEPFVLLLALPGDDVTLEDFVAFYCDGSVGVQIFAGVWHQPPFAINKRVVFDDKQGRVHACVSCDFVQEFNAYLRVPLTSPT